MLWFTSDWHFNHNKEFVYKERNFSDINQMNKSIITLYNNIVQPDDEVYVLGDLMLGDLDEGLNCIQQLNGHLHIVRGNHDTDRRWEAYKNLSNVVELENAIYLKWHKYHFYLSHFPTFTGNIEKEALTQMTINLYGHTHQKNNFYNDIPYMYHVGIDSHNCCPVSIDTIIKEMYEKLEECKQFVVEVNSG